MPKNATLKTLQSELTKAAAPAPAKAQKAAEDGRRPSRKGEILLGAWCDPAFKRSLLMIRTKAPERTSRDLIIEALNDLFAKHNVPTIR